MELAELEEMPTDLSKYGFLGIMNEEQLEDRKKLIAKRNEELKAESKPWICFHEREKYCEQDVDLLLETIKSMKKTARSLYNNANLFDSVS